MVRGWRLFFCKKWPQGIDFFGKVAPPPTMGPTWGQKKNKSKKTGNLQIHLNSRLEKARSSFFKPKKFLAEKAEILWALSLIHI